jgi:hypothetical protein
MKMGDDLDDEVVVDIEPSPGLYEHNLRQLAPSPSSSIGVASASSMRALDSDSDHEGAGQGPHREADHNRGRRGTYSDLSELEEFGINSPAPSQ